MLAALVLGASLTATAPEAAPATPPASQAPPDRAEIERARQERRRRRDTKVNFAGGVGLEVGAGLFYLLTVTVIDDLRGPRPSCDAAANTCGTGSPIAIIPPLAAPALGALGAVRLAAAREANIWRAPLFWEGAAVQFAAYATLFIPVDRAHPTERLAWNAVFLTGAVLGTAMQVWGAAVAAPRQSEAKSRSLGVAPGCQPTSGGLVCGLALAGF